MGVGILELVLKKAYARERRTIITNAVLMGLQSHQAKQWIFRYIYSAALAVDNTSCVHNSRYYTSRYSTNHSKSP